MGEKTQMGYLVIADISGFTSYLAKMELEHAHEILTDLLETIVKEFKTLLTISKLEGLEAVELQRIPFIWFLNLELKRLKQILTN